MGVNIRQISRLAGSERELYDWQGFRGKSSGLVRCNWALHEDFLSGRILDWLVRVVNNLTWCSI